MVKVWHPLVWDSTPTPPLSVDHRRNYSIVEWQKPSQTLSEETGTNDCGARTRIFSHTAALWNSRYTHWSLSGTCSAGCWLDGSSHVTGGACWRLCCGRRPWTGPRSVIRRQTRCENCAALSENWWATCSGGTAATFSWLHLEPVWQRTRTRLRMENCDTFTEKSKNMIFFFYYDGQTYLFVLKYKEM